MKAGREARIERTEDGCRVKTIFELSKKLLSVKAFVLAEQRGTPGCNTGISVADATREADIGRAIIGHLSHPEAALAGQFNSLFCIVFCSIPLPSSSNTPAKYVLVLDW